MHHTGIKTVPEHGNVILCSQFQLHHTGIKTLLDLHLAYHEVAFQLHHTGIKTHLPLILCFDAGNFNCTIQELKLLKDEAQAFAEAISIAPYRN